MLSVYVRNPPKLRETVPSINATQPGIASIYHVSTVKCAPAVFSDEYGGDIIEFSAKMEAENYNFFQKWMLFNLSNNALVNYQFSLAKL